MRIVSVVVDENLLVVQLDLTLFQDLRYLLFNALQLLPTVTINELVDLSYHKNDMLEDRICHETLDKLQSLLDSTIAAHFSG